LGPLQDSEWQRISVSRSGHRYSNRAPDLPAQETLTSTTGASTPGPRASTSKRSGDAREDDGRHGHLESTNAAWSGLIAKNESFHFFLHEILVSGTIHVR
jgi:hypothetical protein